MRLFTLRKRRKLSPLLTWTMKFNIKLLHLPSTTKDYPPLSPTSLQKTLQGYDFLWLFSLRMLTTFNRDQTQNSKLQQIGRNFHWTLRKMSPSFYPYIMLMKQYPLLLNWIHLQGLKFFLHQLESAFSLTYPSLNPQRPYAKVFTRFYQRLVEKW